MARYTELLAEYLESGGKLPAAFDGIKIGDSTLSDIFTAQFAAREIGFETPALFELKLNAYAATLIPELKAGLDAYSGAISAMDKPSHTHTKNGVIQREYGERKRNVWDNPTATDAGEVDLTDVGSQNITVDSGGVDTENYQEVTDVDVSKTAADGIAIYQALSQPAQTFLEVWLAKFDPLFMQIY